MKTTPRTKKQLIASSEIHRQKIKNELSSLTTRTNNLAQNALIGGMIAVAGIAVTKLLIGRKKKSKGNGKQSSGISRIGKVLAEQAMLYILTESRTRIMEYINSLENDDK